MAHRFRVYDVNPEGVRSDTGITIEAYYLPTFYDDGTADSRGDVVEELCKHFKSNFAPNGFTNYVHYWKPRKPRLQKHKQGDLEITYDFGVGHDGISSGVKVVFFLERGG